MSQSRVVQPRYIVNADGTEVDSSNPFDVQPIINGAVVSNTNPMPIVSPTVFIEGFESATGVTGSTDVSNITTSVQHIGIGQYSVSFDKTGTSSVNASIEKTLTALDLTAYTANYDIEFELYISSITNISKVYVSLGTSSSHYISWSVDAEFIVSGWNSVRKGLNYPDTQVGNGINYASVTWCRILVEFNSASDTLSGILADNIELHETATHALEDQAEKSGDAWLDHAISVIKSTYGDTVDIGVKNKDLIKFGRSEQVQTGTYTTLMTLPSGTYNETYPATDANTINYIVSSSASDTFEINIEGHTEASGNKTFVVQNITLTGQTPVLLTTALNRGSRLSVNGAVDNVGTISLMVGNAVTAGVPNTGTDVHCQMRPLKNQSEKCATSLSSQDYWIVTGTYCNMLSKNDYNAEVAFEIRESGGVFKPKYDMSCSKASGDNRNKVPYVIIRPNSDIRLRSLSSNNGAIVAGGIIGVLAKIVT